jgi:hypothetical protein
MSSDKLGSRKAVNDVRKHAINSLYSPKPPLPVGAAPPVAAAAAAAPAKPKKTTRYAAGPSLNPADNFARRRQARLARQELDQTC